MAGTWQRESIHRLPGQRGCRDERIQGDNLVHTGVAVAGTGNADNVVASARDGCAYPELRPCLSSPDVGIEVNIGDI